LKGDAFVVRGVRGAITVRRDKPQEILTATCELLGVLQEKNPGLICEDLASVLFTVTDDIVSVYPAQAAREMGWGQVPLMCAREIPVENSLQLCIRVMIHWNTDLPQEEINHVYLREAAALRPDLNSEN
jgi:chorismate mutase